jgi:AbrB family looped-hinge helix DNA binding protein
MTSYGQEDITVVSGKGQVVIPQPLREKLGLKPKTKLLVYGYKDTVIMKKMEIPNVLRNLKALYKRIDARSAKYGKISEQEINEIVQKYRHKKR